MDEGKDQNISTKKGRKKARESTLAGALFMNFHADHPTYEGHSSTSNGDLSYADVLKCPIPKSSTTGPLKDDKKDAYPNKFHIG